MSKTVKKPSPVQATPVAETMRVEIPRELAAVLADSRSAFFRGWPTRARSTPSYAL